MRSMLAIFLTLLAQLSDCQKQEDFRRDEYDDKYDTTNTMSMKKMAVRTLAASTMTSKT